MKFFNSEKNPQQLLSLIHLRTGRQTIVEHNIFSDLHRTQIFRESTKEISSFGYYVSHFCPGLPRNKERYWMLLWAGFFTCFNLIGVFFWKLIRNQSQDIQLPKLPQRGRKWQDNTFVFLIHYHKQKGPISYMGTPGSWRQPNFELTSKNLNLFHLFSFS